MRKTAAIPAAIAMTTAKAMNKWAAVNGLAGMLNYYKVFLSEPGRVGPGKTGATRPGSDFLYDIHFLTTFIF
jgi:hypothetical protein